jgi:4-carboxymuconolactone decarboxylase
LHPYARSQLEKGGRNVSRYLEIGPEAMTPMQKRVAELISDRGLLGVVGPFSVLIRTPEICEGVVQLGVHLRWSTSLSPRLSELAICLTSALWRAQYEWYAHAPLAVKAGVPEAAIEAIRAGAAPTFEVPDEALVFRLFNEIAETRHLSDASFDEAVALLGENGLVELISIIGFYGMAASILNVFEVAVPDGVARPFPQ